MTTELEKLYTLLNTTLYLDSPVLSGNMKSGIGLKSINDNEVVIAIEAPFYDRKIWEKSGAIVLTGAVVNGKTDYAQSVNDTGGFGTRNKSMHWVNRVCLDVANIIAQEIGAEVINELSI